MASEEKLISHPRLVDVTWRVEPPTKKQTTAAVVVDLQVRSRANVPSPGAPPPSPQVQAQPTRVGEAPELRASRASTLVPRGPGRDPAPRSQARRPSR